ncbi:hypothetical protein GCM10009117_18670 [Gangjinia marincola]|uniref:Photosynthesis system II assembly factor Ycf48/Hcf136-like domain-containing protein n=1 Tax=Gangjinia marincola TaxID=578463 RepID=A0ABN1MHS7_9FLAO
MKNTGLLTRGLILFFLALAAQSCADKADKEENSRELFTPPIVEKKTKKTPQEQMRFAEERVLHERNMQINPTTGELPLGLILREKQLARQELSLSRSRNSVTNATTFETRGPSNLGGRTRALKVDISDPTGNTLLAGGISSGVFRTTNGGASWVKVSSNSDINNASALAQDPRSGFQNIWYYATGEALGNSASVTGAYFGNGIWKSIDSGLTWSKIPGTDSDLGDLDSDFDFVFNVIVHPVTGDLYAATWRGIRRYDGTNWFDELNDNSAFTDIAITTDGQVYAAFAGNSG